MSYCHTLQEQRSGCTLPDILRAVLTSFCHTCRLATLRKNSSSWDLNSASEKKLQQPPILTSSSFLLLGNKGPVGDVGDQGMLGKIGPIGGKGKLWSGNFLGVFFPQGKYVLYESSRYGAILDNAMTSALQIK